MQKEKLTKELQTFTDRWRHFTAECVRIDDQRWF